MNSPIHAYVSSIVLWIMYIMEFARTCILFICISDVLYLIQTTKTEIVCSGKAFEASCDSGQLLLILDSVYGFMNNGTCGVWFDRLNPLGCDNNNTRYLSPRCSGRKSCRYPQNAGETIPNEVMKDANTECKGFGPKVKKMYMEVLYDCYPAPMPREGCMITRMALSGDTGVIAARTITQDCGGSLNLNISAEPGQRIQLTFHDIPTYEDPQGTTVLSGMTSCRPYGNVTEWHPDGRMATPVCGDQDGTPVEWTSSNSSVLVDLNRHYNNIILQYSFLGCPSDTGVVDEAIVIHQNESMAVARCAYDLDSDPWVLTCVNTSWHGIQRQCTAKPIVSAEKGYKKWFVPVIAVAATLVLGTLLVVCVVVLSHKHCLKTNRTGRRELAGNTAIPMVPHISSGAIIAPVTQFDMDGRSLTHWPADQSDPMYHGIADSIPGINVWQHCGTERFAGFESEYPAPPRESYLARLEDTYRVPDKMTCGLNVIPEAHAQQPAISVLRRDDSNQSGAGRAAASESDYPAPPRESYLERLEDPYGVDANPLPPPPQHDPDDTTLYSLQARATPL